MDDLRTKYYDLFMSESNIQFILDFSLKRKKFDATYAKPMLETLMKKTFKEQIEAILSKKSNEMTIEKTIGSLNKNILNEFMKNVDKREHFTTIIENGSKPVVVHNYLIQSNYRNKSEYPLDNKYSLPLQLDNIVGFTIKNIIFNNRIYNIDNSNNRVILIENNQELAISLPLGNYTIENLCDTLSKKLNDLSILNIEYKVEIDHLLKKMVICHAEETYYTYNTIFGLKFTSDLNKILGFTKKEYFNNNQYTAEEFFNLTQNDIVFLKLNHELNRLNTINNDPVCAMIDISQFAFNKTVNLSNIQTFKWNTPVSIKHLNIQWKNIENNDVLLNSDHMINLEFYTSG